MISFYSNLLAYFSKHEWINAFAHALEGFALAVLLQYYMQGVSFVPTYAAWLCIGASFLIHLRGMMKGAKKGTF